MLLTSTFAPDCEIQGKDFYGLYILLHVERVDGQEAVELFRLKATHLKLNPDKFKGNCSTPHHLGATC